MDQALKCYETPGPAGHTDREMPDLPAQADGTTELRAPSELRPTSDPLPDSPGTMALPLRPRNSPSHARASARSVSTTIHSPSSAPAMTRAYSSPVVGTSGRVLLSSTTAAAAGSGSGSGRPSSPLTSYRRYHSPSRRAKDEAALTGVGETVWEESETGQTPKQRTDVDRRHGSSPTVPAYHSHTFPRRHRPSSPLHQVLNPATFTQTRASAATATATATAATATPLSRYNETYPSHQANASISSTSSVPSTPTSTRSRSPSVSSLETIPDSPDAEEAALEAEKIARLKAAADAAERGDPIDTSPMARRRSYLDVSNASPRGTSSFLSGTGAGTGGVSSFYGARDKRKRWSVCGAERRSDLDLETIWED